MAYKANKGRFGVTKSMSTEQLRQLLPDLAKFIAAKTGTVSGIREQRSKALKTLHEQGLDTPLHQKRLVEAWPKVAGPMIARYTLNTYIYNQTLYVRLSNPALRADLSMMRTALVKKLNDFVGEQVITDIKFG